MAEAPGAPYRKASLHPDTDTDALAMSDGYVLRHRRWPAQGPERGTIVAFNGVMSHAAWFFPVAPGLAAAGFTVIGADRRGSGLNEAGRGDVAHGDRFVEDALAVVDHFRARGPVHLLGWCWGATLAVHVALARPDLATVTLATPGMFPSALVKTRAQANEAAAEAVGPDEWVDSPITEDLFTDGPHRAFIDADDLRLKRYSPGMHAAIGKLSFLAAARLRKLTPPTLVLLGEDDDASDNAAARRQAERLTRAEIVALPGRHGIQFDAPDAVVAHVTRFASQGG